MLQTQVKNQQLIMCSCTQVNAHTHIIKATCKCTLKHMLYIFTGLHSCKLPLAFSKTSPWTEASASVAINHVEAGAEGKAHLVHVAPTPGLNKP